MSWWKQEIFQWSDFTSFWSSSLLNRVLCLQLSRQRAFVCSHTFIFEYNNVTKCLAVYSEKKKCCFRLKPKLEPELNLIGVENFPILKLFSKNKCYINIKIFMQLRLGFHTQHPRVEYSLEIDCCKNPFTIPPRAGILGSRKYEEP